MNEMQTKEALRWVDKDTRERLRRVVLISQESDYAIATAVGCEPRHVRAMRDRLVALGVLNRPALDTPPRQTEAAEAFEVSQRGSVRGRR